MYEAIEIEPNYLDYQRNLIAFLSQDDPQRVGQLLISIENLKRKFFYCHDYDELAIKAYLAAGAPQQASRILKQWPERKSKPENLETNIEVALLAQARSKPLIERAKELMFSHEFNSALELLEEAYSIYDKDPLLKINLGLVLQRTGDFQRSTNFLIPPLQISPLPPINSTLELVCLANAAFAEMKSGNYEKAIMLLEDVMWCINAELTDDELAENDLTILPERALWVGIDSKDRSWVLEEHPGSMSILPLMEFAVEQYSRTQLVPDSVSKLIALYKKAAKV